MKHGVARFTNQTPVSEIPEFRSASSSSVSTGRWKGLLSLSLSFEKQQQNQKKEAGRKIVRMCQFRSGGSAGGGGWREGGREGGFKCFKKKQDN